MHDIEKARLIYKLKQAPDVSQSAIDNIANSIGPEIKARLDIVLQSFKLEDLFQNVYSALPWVHLIHGLDENQLPQSSKQTFQVPDSLVVHKNSRKDFVSFLVDVKTVLGEKQTLKNIQIQQSEALAAYSRTLRMPQIYAVYWEKFHFWTLNSLDQLDRKTSSYKIPIADAFVNDLSGIAGDITYIFPQKYIRKVIIDPNNANNPNYIQHEKYGGITNQFISFDRQAFVEIDPIESAIIDSTTKMKQIAEEKHEKIYTILEEAEHPIAIKLSTLILRTLGAFKKDPTADECLIASKAIQNFFLRLNSLSSHMIPKVRTNTSDRLFYRTFNPGQILRTYCKFHKIGIWGKIKLRKYRNDFV